MSLTITFRVADLEFRHRQRQWASPGVWWIWRFFFAPWIDPKHILHRAPVGQGPRVLSWLAIAFGVWSGRALATGTAWAGLCLIHRHQQSHQVFYVKSAQSQYRYKAPYKANPLPENPDATSSSGFRSATAKPVMVNCRPPDYTARDGLHIADGAEPWCGPARRLANPCVARTSGAPSCALFHSPVPGPGHVTRYSANVPWRPRFSSAAPLSMMPSRAGVPIERA